MYLGRKKGRKPRLMEVECFCIVSMIDYRPRFPLALEHNKTVERGVRGAWRSFSVHILQLRWEFTK